MSKNSIKNYTYIIYSLLNMTIFVKLELIK
jgi:hypothetical protein